MTVSHVSIEHSQLTFKPMEKKSKSTLCINICSKDVMTSSKGFLASLDQTITAPAVHISRTCDVNDLVVAIPQPLPEVKVWVPLCHSKRYILFL